MPKSISGKWKHSVDSMIDVLAKANSISVSVQTKAATSYDVSAVVDDLASVGLSLEDV